MIPISDDNRGRRITPVVTWTLIVINVLVYAWQFFSGERGQLDILDQWAAVPREISGGDALHTLVTCAFLHGSWFHLLSNMVFLWVFGDNVEDVMGHVKYIIFYLLCAVGASMTQVLINPDSRVPMVGASGAVAGLLAAYLVLFPHGKIRTLIFLGVFVTTAMVSSWVMIGLWIVLQVISGVTSLNQIGDSGGGVAFWAHIGGFVVGLLLVFVFRNKQRQDEQNVARQQPADAGRVWGIQPGGRR